MPKFSRDLKARPPAHFSTTRTHVLRLTPSTMTSCGLPLRLFLRPSGLTDGSLSPGHECPAHWRRCRSSGYVGAPGHCTQSSSHRELPWRGDLTLSRKASEGSILKRG